MTKMMVIVRKMIADDKQIAIAIVQFGTSLSSPPAASV